MQIEIDGQTIHYIEAGEGEPLLLLHGWGAEIASFQPVIQALAPYRRVIALDFPGFGKSPEPSEPWAVADYARLTAGFMEALKIQGTDIICHSFGGRVTIILAATRPELVGKLVFVDAAGLKKRRSLGYYVKVYSYKFMKKAAKTAWLKKCLGWLGIRPEERIKNAGSEDYQKTSGVMRGTFVKTVNQDLKEYLPRIQASSLMIYGREDTATPVYFGEKMAKLIPDGGLVVLENAGHFSYLDQFPQFIAIVKVFLGVKG